MAELKGRPSLRGGLGHVQGEARQQRGLPALGWAPQGLCCSQGPASPLQPRALAGTWQRPSLPFWPQEGWLGVPRGLGCLNAALLV